MYSTSNCGAGGLARTTPRMSPAVFTTVRLRGMEAVLRFVVTHLKENVDTKRIQPGNVVLCAGVSVRV